MKRIVPRASAAAVADVYDDLRGQVRAAALRFARAYALDADDVAAAANLYFLEAYHTFDPVQGELGARVVYYVRSRLLDEYRPRWTAANRLPVGHGEPDSVGREPPAWSLAEFCEFHRLTPDARAVLTLLLDSPADLDDEIRAGPPTDATARQCLYRYLRRNLKWASDQILDAFQEIRDALS
jgi:hypothetical protein